MNLHELLLLVHLLGWVFWLGTDVGVFFSAKYAERGDLSAETRLTVLELGLFLDRWPRFSMPIVWFTGVAMMNDLGYSFLTVPVAAVLTVIWLAVTWVVVFQEPGSPNHIRGAIAQTLILAAVIVGMGGGASYLLATGAMPLWLALKWFAYVLVAVTVIVLEKKFMPVGPLLGELAENGGSDDLNARLSAVLKPVYPVVLAIYAWTLLAAFAGVSKIS